MRGAPLKFCLTAIVALLIGAIPLAAQNSQGYELEPAPDIWYNDVDGIRVGLRIRGQMPGTFEDGPHRLDAGFWYSTWNPELPVSYYLSFTEPIFALSDFGSEANVRLYSSIRAGFSRHGLEFNKRWQQGFEEAHFIGLSFGFGIQERFDREYVPYPVIWQEERLWLGHARFDIRNRNGLGRYHLKTELAVNLLGEAPTFINSSAEFRQIAELGSGFAFRGRLFAGVASEDTPPEYLLTRSFLPAVYWAGGGLTRAKGTIPTSWMDSGLFQVAGGPNLRGYTEQDIELLAGGAAPLFTSMGAVNIELDYPNPLDRAIREIPVIGGVMRFRSYLFADSGTSLGISAIEESRTLSDAGVGFELSLNIPDYLGNPRGISIRYDIPLWLSNPEGDEHFSYRSLIGIGAVISL